MAGPSFAQGAVLTKDVLGTPLVIASVSSISGPSSSADQIDVTAHDSALGFRQFLRGLVDPGTITFEVFYDGGNATHKALMADFADKTLPADDWKVLFAEGSFLLFNAKVNGFEFSVPIDGALTASVTLQITGPITYPTV